MTGIKKCLSFFNKLKGLVLRSKRQIIIASLSFFGVLSFALFIFALVMSPAEKALVALEKSLIGDPPCHEGCLLARRQREKIIVSKLRTSERLKTRFASYIKSNKTEAVFKKELVKLLALAHGSANPPSYLQEYLDDKDGDPEVQGLITILFSRGHLNRRSMNDNLKDSAANADSNFSRLAAIRGLSITKDSSLSDFYFSLLSRDNDEAVREEAARALSNIPEKNKNFKVEQLSEIGKMLLGEDSSGRLRASLIFLLGDYYRLFPEKTNELVKDFYNSSSSDEVSRALAADLFNHFNQEEKLDLPQLNEADWEGYYKD